MKINHIKQGYKECGPASFAMVMGISLKKSKQIFKKLGWAPEKNGLTRREIMTALDDLGHDCRYSDGQYMKKHAKELKRPAILMVESKNEEAGYHILVYYKNKVYDPQEGNKKCKTYTNYSLKKLLKKTEYIIESKKRKIK